MKLFISLIAFMALCSFAPAENTVDSINLPIIVAIITGCYEVVSRVIPTSKKWSLIGKLLQVLTWASDLFDRKK